MRIRNPVPLASLGSLCVAFAALTPLRSWADPPQIECSSTPFQVVVGGAAAVIDAAVTVTGNDPIDGTLVLITDRQSGDALSFDSGSLPSGVSGSFNSGTGVLTFSGSASAADWQTLLRTVALSVTSTAATTREITFTLGSSLPFADNGHYYEFVSDPGIAWSDARTEASARTLFGLEGYLVTVTSAAENAFVAGKLAGKGWLGAADANESEWRWVTGPEGLEDSGAGRHFFTQTSACSSSPNQGWVYFTTPGGGNDEGGNYSNWAAGEPNDCYATVGEDYAHFFEDGTWNDYPVSLPDVDGYVVEYGGMPGDPVIQISASRTGNLAHQLSYTAGSNGTISGTSSQMVNHGDDGTQVSAVADSGYHFVQWSDASTDNPRTDTNVTASLSVSAQFEINTYTLTYTAGANGSLSGTTSQSVEHGSDGSSVTAVPNAGYRFIRWSDGSTANPRTDLNVQSDISVTAQFEPIALATVSTAAVTEVTTTSATAGGNVSDSGGGTVTQRGVCWATTQNPTTAGSTQISGAGTGSFEIALTGLSPETTYYVRAYAINESGTAYGSQRSFTTASVPQEPPAEDPPADDPPSEDPTAADIRVTVSGPDDPARVGDDVSFMLDVANVGTAAAPAVVVRLPLPPGMEFVAARLVAEDAAQTVALEAAVEGDEVVISLGDMAVGADMRIELVLRARQSGPVTLTASATFEGADAPSTDESSAAVEDVYWEIVETFVPVHACGWLGLSPALLLAGLVGLKRRGAVRW